MLEIGASRTAYQQLLRAAATSKQLCKILLAALPAHSSLRAACDSNLRPVCSHLRALPSNSLGAPASAAQNRVAAPRQAFIFYIKSKSLNVCELPAIETLLIECSAPNYPPRERKSRVTKARQELRGARPSSPSPSKPFENLGGANGESRARAVSQALLEPLRLHGLLRPPAVKIEQSLQVPNSTPCLETRPVALTEWELATPSPERATFTAVPSILPYSILRGHTSRGSGPRNLACGGRLCVLARWSSEAEEVPDCSRLNWWVISNHQPPVKLRAGP